jgi:integrase
MAKVRFPKGLGSKPKFDENRQQWVSQISVGFKRNGKRNRRTVRAATQPELLEKLQAIRQEVVEDGELQEITGDTITDIAKSFLSWVEINKKVKTWEDYDCTFRNVIKPYIGKVRASKFTTSEAADFINSLQTEHKKSACQSKKAHQFLKAAFKMAVANKRVRLNPLMGVAAPTYGATEQKFLTTAEQVAFMKGALAHPRLAYRALLSLALDTGARQGELFALEWSDFDFTRAQPVVHFTKNVVLVKKTNEHKVQATKTAAGLRTVPISGTTTNLLKELRKENMESVRVFSSPRSGKYINPSAFHEHAWSPLLKRVGVDIKFHSLRHTTASRWIAQGIPMHIIAKWLGHANPKVTMQFYAHLLEEQSTMGADGFDALLDGKATDSKVIDLAARREGTTGS